MLSLLIIKQLKIQEKSVTCRELLKRDSTACSLKAQSNRIRPLREMQTQ